MPRRHCSTDRVTVTAAIPRIILPHSDLESYRAIVADASRFRQWVDEAIERYPELFPPQIAGGYRLHDQRASRKMAGIRLRRIKLKEADEQGRPWVLTVAPSALLPYMTGESGEVDKALFLLRFGVPCWALAFVFGRNESYWYRQAAHFGRYSLVETLCKPGDQLPQALAGDEKFICWNGQTAYAAMTVGEECVLGISVAMEATTSALSEAYGTFQHEAQGFDPRYAPQTVNTDGWVPTQMAWRTLFPLIVLVRCFLHAWLKVRERGRRLPEAVASGLHRTIWQAYHCPTAADLTAALQKLRSWAEAELKGTVQDYVLKLCASADHFAAAYAYPTAHRTSNMIDRHMRSLERWLLGRKAFHGHWRSTELQLRGWAHFHNFGPYCPRAAIGQHFRSPAHRLTGRLYHENWLQNLLVSTSLAGFRPHHKIR